MTETLKNTPTPENNVPRFPIDVTRYNSLLAETQPSHFSKDWLIANTTVNPEGTVATCPSPYDDIPSRLAIVAVDRKSGTARPVKIRMTDVGIMLDPSEKKSSHMIVLVSRGVYPDDLLVDIQLNGVPLVFIPISEGIYRYYGLISSPKDESPKDASVIAAARELRMNPQHTVQVGDKVFYPSDTEAPIQAPLIVSPGETDVLTIRVMEIKQLREIAHGTPVTSTGTLETRESGDPALIGYYRIIT